MKVDWRGKYDLGKYDEKCLSSLWDLLIADLRYLSSVWDMVDISSETNRDFWVFFSGDTQGTIVSIWAPIVLIDVICDLFFILVGKVYSNFG